jgi:lysophospholipase L1-like esterase
MRNNKSLYGLIIIFFLLLSTGFSLTTWKMFRFRDRLHEFVDNDRWEKTLSKNKIYDNDLIVFFGDSQVDLWWMAPSFGTLPIVNKGISGDWALKAIDRFDKDVLALKPKLLVMLIGTNDLGNGQTIEEINSNIDVMLNKAANQDIKIILCSLLPVRGKYIGSHSLKYLLQLNKELKLLSQIYNADYVDFYSQLIDENGTFKVEFTSDGLHPNRAGYIKMSKIIMPYLLKKAVKFID